MLPTIKCPHREQQLWCSCFIEGVAHLQKQLAESEEERKALLAERDDALRTLTRLVYAFRRPERGDAPGHSHQVPGIWDKDNGERAGKPCELCLAWAQATRIVGEP